MDLDLLTSPTRYLVALKAIHATLAATPGVAAILNTWPSEAIAIEQESSEWPDGAAILVLVSRGARQPENLTRGGTSTQWRGTVRIAVLSRDDDPTTALDTQDAAEVVVYNALNALRVARTAADRWDLEPGAISPGAVDIEDAPPYQTSRIDIETWGWE